MKDQKVVLIEKNAKKLMVFKEPIEPQPDGCMHWDTHQCCVVHWSHANIESLLNDHQTCLVLFYDTPCKYFSGLGSSCCCFDQSFLGYNTCKVTFDEFVKASENLKNDTRFVLAAIDCTKYENARWRYKIESYPTLKYFSKGVEKAYTGKNTVKLLIGRLNYFH
jgi:thiol-disulfide isomerase/thioredoxin